MPSNRFDDSGDQPQRDSSPPPTGATHLLVVPGKFSFPFAILGVEEKEKLRQWAIAEQDRTKESCRIADDMEDELRVYVKGLALDQSISNDQIPFEDTRVQDQLQSFDGMFESLLLGIQKADPTVHREAFRLLWNELTIPDLRRLRVVPIRPDSN